MTDQTEALKLVENPTMTLAERQSSKSTVKTVSKKKVKISSIKYVPKITQKTISKKVVKKKKVSRSQSEQGKD